MKMRFPALLSALTLFLLIAAAMPAFSQWDNTN